MRYLGMRVLRGPDWDQDDADGGEGHLGTVVEVKVEEGAAEVVWDNGQVTTCRVGKECKHDLRIYDNAPAGCISRGVVCQGCSNSSIYGTSWRCSTCSNFHLCSRCYHLEAHPLSHHFLRRDDPTQEVAVGTRSGASRIPVFGIFPEARVARGRDWEYGDADGGPDGSGVVVEVVSPERVSARNAVRVSWDSGQSLQHRLGLHGKVDLVCTEEAPGPACYVSHLPVLSTSLMDENSTRLEAYASSPNVPATSGATSLKGKTKIDLGKDFRRVREKDVTMREPPTLRADEVKLSKTDMTTAKGDKLDKPAVATAERTGRDKESLTKSDNFALDTDGEIRVGDRVEVGVEFDIFKDIQSQTASWTDNMEQCLGRTGVVKSVTATGQMEVDFEGSVWRISSICLTKVTTTSAAKVKEGDTVRIISDVRLLQEQQKDHGGWNSDMAQVAGKVGKVKKVTPRGDVEVSLGQQSWVFNSQSCRPAPGCPTDFMPTGETDSLLHALLSEGSPKVKEFMDAAKGGNTAKIADMLERDPGLAHEERNGGTALHFACSEGQTEVVRLLVAKGANINGGDYHKDTPLMLAIFRRHRETAKALVELGADVNLGNSKRITPLQVAVSVNCIDSVRLLLANKASVNVRNSKNLTPLYMAAMEDADDAIIDAILAVEDLDLRLPNKQQATCLHVAVYTDKTRLAEKVLARDPGVVDAAMDQGFTALHLIAQENHVDIGRLLLRKNARINARDVIGRTPLHIAALADHMECSRLLVESGADINACTDDLYTPLHFCVGSYSSQAQLMRGDKGLELAKYLIQHGARTDMYNAKGRTPLDTAPRAVRTKLERFLQEHGDTRDQKSKGNLNADVECNDPSALTDRGLGDRRPFRTEVHTNDSSDPQQPAEDKPVNNEEAKIGDGAKPDIVRLFLTLDSGDIPRIKAMLEQDPNLVRETHEGQTALHYAAMQGQTEAVRLLVAKGSDINKGDNDDDTPLLRSILALRTETAGVLMELGSDVNHMNGRVMTPLHLAVAGDAIDIVRQLLQHRANVNLRNQDGNTPLVLALCMDHTSPAVVEALLEARDLDLRVTTDQDANALHMAVHKNKTWAVEKILAKDSSLVNVLMERRKSPLHIAARDSHFETLKILLKAGANVNARDQSGRTPLHLACPGDYREIARALVQHGADLNVRNEDGNTPLHFCVGFHSGRNRFPSADKGLELAKYLIQHGARTDLYNNRGQTVLDAAQPVVKEGLKRILSDRGSQTEPRNSKRNEINNPSSPVQSTPSSTMCATCHQRVADVIFLPCAHKLLCGQCAGSTRSCRECGLVIEGRIDTEGNAVGQTPSSVTDQSPKESGSNKQQECKVQ